VMMRIVLIFLLLCTPALAHEERAALSVTDSCRRRGGDETSIGFRIRESVVNIAQSSEFHECDRVSTGWTGTIAVYEACLCTAGCHRPCVR
jgi:hypothetical protein